MGECSGRVNGKPRTRGGGVCGKPRTRGGGVSGKPRTSGGGVSGKPRAVIHRRRSNRIRNKCNEAKDKVEPEFVDLDPSEGSNGECEENIVEEAAQFSEGGSSYDDYGGGHYRISSPEHISGGSKMLTVDTHCLIDIDNGLQCHEVAANLIDRHYKKKALMAKEAQDNFETGEEIQSVPSNVLQKEVLVTENLQNDSEVGYEADKEAHVGPGDESNCGGEGNFNWTETLASRVINEEDDFFTVGIGQEQEDEDLLNLGDHLQQIEEAEKLNAEAEIQAQESSVGEDESDDDEVVIARQNIYNLRSQKN